MTEEELKYYTALQPVFKGKIGDFIPSDRVSLDGEIGFIWRIKGKKDGGLIYCMWPNDTGSCDKPKWAYNNFIRLPLPIDPENPERGLNGMLESGILHVGRVRSMVEIEGINYFHSPTPTLALLKALAHQEGIAV